MVSSLSVPISPGPFGHSSCSDVQALLQLLEDWLQNGREGLCQEFEQHLRESYTWPASERRWGSMATSATCCGPLVNKFGLNGRLGFNQWTGTLALLNPLAHGCKCLQEVCVKCRPPTEKI